MAGNIAINNANGNTVTLQNPDTNTEDLVIDLSAVGDGSVAPYHIYNGSVEATNTVATNGFSTTLYTGNGGTQSITTNVDMNTQWGNDASETYGGLVWLKGRSGATSNYLVDTVRGATKDIYSDAATAETTEATGLTAFSSTGFSLGTLAGMNTNLATYASWAFQTTHRKFGTTNQGKTYTEHYNPYTGFTIIQYTGSGMNGHEIPHSLNRKLGFVTVKNLQQVYSWYTAKDNNLGLYLNLINAESEDTTHITKFTDTSTILGTGIYTNTSTNQYIMYGWANSYYDEKSTLIGNYEIGVYQGTGAAGNKVTTRGKPAWIMVKRLDSNSDWLVYDIARSGSLLTTENRLYANLANAEGVDGDTITELSSGFVPLNVTINNASGGQYLYMVVYDNDFGSGKSKYPKATDITNLTIDALVPYANGIGTNGNKVSISYKNETISGLTLTQGKNYIFSKNDGTYGSKTIAPNYGITNPLTGDFFNLKTLKWYDNTNAETTPRNYLDCIVYADQNGQLTYVEELPKTTYLTDLKVTDGFDLGQTLIDVTTNRSAGVTYTNNTGKPIILEIYFDICSYTFIHNGFSSGVMGGAGDRNQLIVPIISGDTYRINISSGTIIKWLETR